MADVEAGLSRVPETTYFRGHLYLVLGQIEERRAAALREGGSHEPAREAEARALRAYLRAKTVQEEVIRRSIPDPR